MEVARMVVLRTVDTRLRLVTAGRVLLRRRGVVYPPAVAGGDAGRNAAGVDLLETDLVERGWLLSPALRDHLLHLDTATLVGVGAALLADCDALLGADRPHLPLFRDFPVSTPTDTFAFFVERVLASWFQWPERPCVLCGADGAVAPVNPCGHLVCRSCFDGADFSACPICHRRIDGGDPFLRPARPRPEATAAADPLRLRVLHAGGDLAADALAEALALLARPGALPPGDVDDLATLLGTLDPADRSWLPERVPGRETKARLLAWLLTDPLPADAFGVAATYVDTATDVLRLLVARSGGASLLDRPRLTAVSRPLRRVLLALLDRIHPVRLVEDMRRHRRAWIAAGERLHPGEHAARFPGVALAFAALRGTDLSVHADGRRLAGHAALLDQVDVDGGRVVVGGRGRRVELALARRDVPAALAALAARPGELMRRADHLLRLGTAPDPVLDAMVAAAPAVSPAVLLSTLGALRVRAGHHRQRVFFPAGRTATAHVVPDERAPLPRAVVDRATGLLRDEVLRRAAALPTVERAVLDAALGGLVAPFAERTAARALVTLARGSVLPLPEGRHLRLFCHWTESGQRVDLDLSLAVYDHAWTHVATCDYTRLRAPGAVHSGDLTSAPPPLGSSEFIDLDTVAMLAAGARYAVVTIMSYNGVAFTGMAEAFAGFMLRADEPAAGEVFDARAVEQRFDLTGPGRVTMPFVVDLQRRTLRWLDVNAHVTGTDHAVHRHRDRLATIAGALTESFGAGARVTLGELAAWHAAARATEVVVRIGGGLSRYRRRAGEPAAAFADRLGTPDREGTATAADAAGAALQFLVRGDLPTPGGAEVYALHPHALDATSVRLLPAADLAGLLAVPPRDDGARDTEAAGGRRL
jgi:hypothetical protein